MAWRKTVILGAAVVGVAACGGSTTLATTTPAAAPVASTAGPVAPASSAAPTTAAADYGSQYVAITAPANDALSMWRSAIRKLGSDSSPSVIANVTATVAVVLDGTNHELLRAHWPASAEADVKAVVWDEGALIGDLSAVGRQNWFTAASWESHVSADAGKASAAADVVRADLGLPPLSQ
jgi:hypothetical protein